MFNQEAFNRFVVDNKVIGFFETPIQLKSGKKSHWYVNWRSIANDVYLLEKTVEFVLAFAKDKQLNPTCFYGVPEGATKLGVLCQYHWAKQAPNYGPGSHILAMGRSKPKEHGSPQDRYFIGMPPNGTVVLEDVTTTGGSLIATIQTLQANQIQVSAAIGLTNRMAMQDSEKTVEQAIADLGIPYYAMSHADHLMKTVLQKEKPASIIVQSVKSELRL